MVKEGLEDVEELQSYMIKHFAKHLQSKDKIIIGWDEIMEGGLADEAVVMSWRGAKGGIEAAEQKHHVIMSPNTYVYFDYYQASKKTEPLAIGGYLPLSKVYEFNPIPNDLPKEYHKYVLGGQANVWTEYMPDFIHLQYMIFPRLLALSESVWTNNEQKDWGNFSERVELMMNRFDVMDVNYSSSAYNLRSDLEYNSASKHLELSLFNEFSETEIRFTTDQSEPTKKSKRYSLPLPIEKNTIVKAQVFIDENAIGSVIIDSINMAVNKAFGKKVIYKNKYTEKYNSGEAFGLVDQQCGSLEFDDRKWQGWFDEDVEFLIELDENMKVNEVSLGLLVDRKNQILLPRKVQILTSTNNMDYKMLSTFINEETLNDDVKIVKLNTKGNSLKANYIKVRVQNSSNNKTAEKGWTFIDELIVR